jgi:hypothetical protein
LKRFRRADTVRGREQLFGGDDLVVAGAEQEDRMAPGGKINLPRKSMIRTFMIAAASAAEREPPKEQNSWCG